MLRKLFVIFVSLRLAVSWAMAQATTDLNPEPPPLVETSRGPADWLWVAIVIVLIAVLVSWYFIRRRAPSRRV